MMGWYDHGSWWGWGMAVMMIAWLLVVAAVVWLAVRLAQRPPDTSAGPSPSQGESAREVLDRRLAVGEIDEQQYLHARRLIEAGGGQLP